MTSDVVIVGAGPYGLSVAAHLRAARVDTRIFGRAMDAWRTGMPHGMRLKSDGFASNLSDPGGEFTLARYCAERNLPYADLGLPVPIETFIDYGLAFQQRLVPNLEEVLVRSITRAHGAFEVETEAGERITARRVVLAIGIQSFAHVPDQVAKLPSDLWSHSSEHVVLDTFAGREVVILGGGSSALDLAALARRAGAHVEVVARHDIEFHRRMRLPRRLRDRVIAPSSGLGPGWRTLFYTDAAPLFRRLPDRWRLETVRQSLGPVGGWFIRDEVIGKVPLHENLELVSASAVRGRVRLDLAPVVRSVDAGSCDRTIEAEHVIAATGYRPRLDQLPILSPELRSSVTTVGGTPALTAYFESSVKGLYFVGPLAANSFGPMMRFAYGARFTARRLTHHLARGR